MALLLPAVVCTLNGFFSSVGLGCMYTVRDMAFVNIGAIPYRLYYYIREDTPKEITTVFKQISYAALMDSNVEVQMVNVQQQKDHPAMEYLRFWEIKSFPAAILVSPKRHSLVLPISIQNKPFKETVWSAMDNIVSSPKREEILQHIAKVYCMVLLIEGKDTAENKRAQWAVSNAIGDITKIMSQMPKTVEKPPCLILIPRESLSEERILLWSLGVNENEVSEPYVAVLYGRGRRIGSLLKGKQITQSALFNILSVIGSACECGLDREWVLGTMIPLGWDEKVQSEAANQLGFDAENPMVKIEISQILSLGSSSRMEGEGSVGSLGGRLYGYREETVELEGEPSVRTISPAQFHKMDSPGPTSSGIRPIFRTSFLIIGGMVLLILAGGIFIILRARRKAS